MTTIKLRRGTASRWSIVNPVLAEGEAGFETDTGKLKIGDGLSVWSDLDYIGVYADGAVDGAVLQASSGSPSGYAWVAPIATMHSSLDGTGEAGCHPASAITNTPAGGIAATTVQAAIDELDTDKAAASHTHSPEDISTGGAAEGSVLTIVDGVPKWVVPG